MIDQADTQKIFRELSSLREEVGRLRSQVEHLEQTLRPTLQTEHPHVVRIQGVHGGRPILRGTGVSVQTIVEQSRLGQSPQAIVDAFDGILTLAQVYDALSYYHEHKQEIEHHISENREALLWKAPRIESP